MNDTQVQVADFWFPTDETSFTTDPRYLVTDCLEGVDTEPAIEVENPNCPPPFLGISSGFFHTVDHGILTEDIFFQDIRNAAGCLADLIKEQYSPFQPIRFYRPAKSSYGVSPYTFSGEPFGFDIRVVGMFERSIGYEVAGETRYAPGVKYFLTTMVVPDPERDKDVHVGHDWGSQYDG